MRKRHGVVDARDNQRDVRVFESLHDADADDVAFYSSMDPQERLDLVVELSRQVFGEPD